MNKANILFKEECRQFHLTNDEVSYIFRVSEDGKLLQLYYGAGGTGAGLFLFGGAAASAHDNLSERRGFTLFFGACTAGISRIRHDRLSPSRYLSEAGKWLAYY